jgi:hypothetical protein
MSLKQTTNHHEHLGKMSAPACGTKKDGEEFKQKHGYLMI